MDLEQLGEQLCLRVSTDRAPSSGTMQLVADRVEATDGMLDASQAAILEGTVQAGAFTTVVSWSVTAQDPKGAPT